jgi:hypothetical protein
MRAAQLILDDLFKRRQGRGHGGSFYPDNATV